MSERSSKNIGVISEIIDDEYAMNNKHNKFYSIAGDKETTTKNFTIYDCKMVSPILRDYSQLKK